MMKKILSVLLCILAGVQTMKAQEAYAEYTPDNLTLSFYYDNLRSTRTGRTYVLNNNQRPDWYKDGTNANVTKVSFHSSFANARRTTMSFWFNGMENLQLIEGIANLNTSKSSNLGYMFTDCKNLTSIDLSHFDTSNCETIDCMFKGCTGLKSIDVSNFITTKVTNMRGVFQDCSALKSISVTNFYTTNVKITDSMFEGCIGLTTLDLSNFNTANVTSMYRMFAKCSNLTTIYVSSLWSTNSVNTGSQMFLKCSKLVGGQGTTYNDNNDGYAYARIDGGSADPGYFTARPLEAYANYTPLNTTLTFYCDALRKTRTGKTYDLNAGCVEPKWYSDGTYANVTTVVFDPSFANARPTTAYFWFNEMSKLNDIVGISYFNTSEVQEMTQLFYKCTTLTSLDLSHFNTAKVTDMHGMFESCSSLKSLNLGNFNTTNVTGTYAMSGMFYNCSNLETLDLTGLSLEKPVGADLMFANCPKLKTIYVSSKWSTATVTSSRNMFNNCTSLVGGQGTTYDASHVDAAYAHIDGGSADPGYFTVRELEAYACYIAENTTLTFYYDAIRSTRSGKTFGLNTSFPEWGYSINGVNSNATHVVFDPSFADARPTTTESWFSTMLQLQSITGIEYLNTSEVTNMRLMFNKCSKLGSVDLSHFNTSKVTNMNAMFQNCSAMTSLDLSNFDTSNVTDFSFMFNNCNNLTNLDLSAFNTSNATDMSSMFALCSKLESVDVSHFNTANVTTMNRMFGSCYKLKSIDVGHFNVSKVTDMASMFDSCNSLTSIDVSNFVTSKVTDMGFLFASCPSLTSLDLSAFDTHNVTRMERMFSKNRNLKTIFVGSSWSTGSVTSSGNMFDECNSLVGSQGTAYNAGHVDASYAHVDGGTSNPGYFTSVEGLVKTAYALLSTDGQTLTFYYDYMKDLRTGTAYNLNLGGTSPQWYSDNSCENVREVVFHSSFSNMQPTSTCSWFDGMKNLTTITGLSNLNTSQVTNMKSMFRNCRSLTELDLSSFNTANVTTMNAMFEFCQSLKNLNLSNFKTARVTTMYLMFDECNVLTALDLSSFNTAKVTNMSSMFSNCRALNIILVSSSWTTDAVTSSDQMFSLCTSIVGGRGTTYSYSHVDKEYARIDGGYSRPGYLTDRGNPYVVLSDDGKTFTFYADGRRLLHTERTYGLNENSATPDWEPDTRGVTSVVFDPSFASARPTSTFGWFTNMAQLTTITNLEYLNTSEVTEMNQMFYDCEKLTNLDLSHFNTAKVTEMWMMFYECTSLKNLDLTSFNTEKVSVMNEMFSGCTSLISIDLSSFYTSQTRYMNEMFSGCTSLTTVSVGDGWDASRASTEYMFFHCYSIVGELGTTYNSDYNGDYVGEDAAHIDWEDYPGFFVSANYLKVPYAHLSADGRTLTFYHDGQRATRRASTVNSQLSTFKTYSTDLATNEEPGWFNDGNYSDITRAVFDPSFANARPVSTYYWFGQMHLLTNIDGMEFLNTSEVISMEAMFEECESLTSLDVSHFDTRNVTDMRSLFNDCYELTTLDVSGFDTHNVTAMYNMFNYCSNLTELDLSNFDTQNVVSMNDMFCACESLTSLDLSNFNTANVTRMSSMFEGCKSLSDIDLSSFETSRVTNMNSMFDGCPALKSLDLRSFSTYNVTTMLAMFRGCTALETIYVTDYQTIDPGFVSPFGDSSSSAAGLGWTTENVTSSNNMFKDCTSLRGHRGTRFDANHIDKEYARLDGGTSSPGYLSEYGAFLLGDVNGDGQVGIGDIVAITNVMAGIETDPAIIQRADVNGDTQVGIGDIVAITNIMAGITN
ncbi:MAG: BspA family leucine-rich repeat surface protein [Prevotella sp.]|nr:BspA family leucine-rich repeat surface protein [Prevotella sp.]